MHRLVCLALLLSACADDVAKDKVHATVSDPPPAAAPAAPAAGGGPAAASTAGVAAGELKVDPARSSIHALGAKITMQHDITFPTFEGTARLDGDTVTGVSFTVQVGSLKVDPEKALRAANAKFVRRFRFIEAQLAARGTTPAAASLDEMEALWIAAKSTET